MYHKFKFDAESQKIIQESILSANNKLTGDFFINYPIFNEFNTYGIMYEFV